MQLLYEDCGKVTATAVHSSQGVENRPDVREGECQFAGSEIEPVASVADTNWSKWKLDALQARYAELDSEVIG